MKKYIIILIILLLSLSGCRDESLIQEDFKKDIDQVLGTLNKAYEENRELDDNEKIIIDKFNDKYIVGKYLTNDGNEYEMNDLEKEIANDIEDLGHFTKSEERLASEEDLYTTTKKDIMEYLKAKEIPAELKDRYDTYEIYSGIHPAIKDDANEITNLFDPLVNGTAMDIDRSTIEKLDSFISVYKAKSFEIEGKQYLLNDEGWNVLYAFMELKNDIESGGLTNNTRYLFNQVKEDISK